MLLICFNDGSETLGKNRWKGIFLLRAVLILVVVEGSGQDCPWLATLLKVRSRKGPWTLPFLLQMAIYSAFVHKNECFLS